MTTVIQFLVLKRDNKWVVKSGDSERFFSTQREGVDAAIRSANDSGKEGKPARCSSKNRNLNSKRFGHTERIPIRPQNQIYP
jgi:hypothetical protein